MSGIKKNNFTITDINKARDIICTKDKTIANDRRMRGLFMVLTEKLIRVLESGEKVITK